MRYDPNLQGWNPHQALKLLNPIPSQYRSKEKRTQPATYVQIQSKTPASRAPTGSIAQVPAGHNLNPPGGKLYQLLSSHHKVNPLVSIR